MNIQGLAWTAAALAIISGLTAAHSQPAQTTNNTPTANFWGAAGVPMPTPDYWGAAGVPVHK